MNTRHIETLVLRDSAAFALGGTGSARVALTDSRRSTVKASGTRILSCHGAGGTKSVNRGEDTRNEVEPCPFWSSEVGGARGRDRLRGRDVCRAIRARG